MFAALESARKISRWQYRKGRRCAPTGEAACQMNFGEEWCADVARPMKREHDPQAQFRTRPCKISRGFSSARVTQLRTPRAADSARPHNGAAANARRKRERMQSDAELARRFQPIVRELINAGRECVLAAFHVER